MKFDMRLPFDRISEQMQQQRGLPMSSATAFEITHRVSEDLQEEYRAVVEQVRASKVVNVDETSLEVDGVNYWLWVFTTAVCTLFVVRKSRGKRFWWRCWVRVLGGLLGVMGLRCIVVFQIGQRCWVHLLREVEVLSKGYVEAEEFYLGYVSSFMILVVVWGRGWLFGWGWVFVRRLRSGYVFCLRVVGLGVRGLGGLFRRFGEVFALV